jgi:hypothetical protein
MIIKNNFDRAARGVTMSLACLLVCLAAASRYAPRKGTGE